MASTVLPSSAMIWVSVPDVGAGTSTLTLSVSSSHSISSASTWSPTVLNHVLTVASDTDSPKVGTMTSTSSAASRGFTSSAPASTALGASDFAGAASPSEILASSASTPTVSPSAATMSARVPATGEGTSTVTLSVSSSQSISSTATLSPGFLNHVATVASVTDSPKVGTRTSLVMVIFLRWSALRQRGLLVVLCVGRQGRSQARPRWRDRHRSDGCGWRRYGPEPIRYWVR